eukprot:3978157-Prymnesium_polylepis.1
MRARRARARTARSGVGLVAVGTRRAVGGCEAGFSEASGRGSLEARGPSSAGEWSDAGEAARRSRPAASSPTRR